MDAWPLPDETNGYLAPHITDVLRSFHELTGKHLVQPCGDPVEMARLAFEAPFCVLSHDGGEDPILSYGNRCALELFEMDWEQLVRTPSRFTAEAPNREERQRLLETVTEKGFIDDYSGIRISAKGRRFLIRQATVWNVSDVSGEKIGQAATFSVWEFSE